MTRDYLKTCCSIAAVCIALSGCRMEEDRESAQLKGYIDSISHKTLRQESADMLVGSSLSTEEYKSSYCVVFANEKYISFRAANRKFLYG